MTSHEQTAVLARVALVWALTYGAVRTYWQLAGFPADLSPIGSDLVVFTDWWGVALCGVAAVVAGAMLRAGARAVLPLLMASFGIGVALVASAALLVLDLIGGVFPGIGLEHYPVGAVSRIACAAAGVLLVVAARSLQRRTGVALPLADRFRGLSAPLDRTPAWGYCAAYVSMAACLTRIGAQVVVGLDDSPLSGGVAGVAFESCFLLAGTLLPLALVHGWGRVWPRWVLGLAGRRVPRRLVLLPAIAVSAMIVVYFGVMLVQMVVERLQGRNPFPPDAKMDLPEAFFWVAVPAYFVWGATLGVAAFAYHRRTRAADPAPHSQSAPAPAGRPRTPAPHSWARRAAHLVPLLVLPSGVWRLALLVGLPVADVTIHEWWEVVYIVGLVALSEGAALLTLGLVQPWGETVPAWIPLLGGRQVRPLAAFVPAMTGATFLTVLWVWVFTGIATTEFQSHFESTWQRVLLTICYAPLLAWGPVLAGVAIAYRRRRRLDAAVEIPSPEGDVSLAGGMARAARPTRLDA